MVCQKVALKAKILEKTGHMPKSIFLMEVPQDTDLQEIQKKLIEIYGEIREKNEEQVNSLVTEINGELLSVVFPSNAPLFLRNH